MEDLRSKVKEAIANPNITTDIYTADNHYKLRVSESSIHLWAVGSGFERSLLGNISKLSVSQTKSFDPASYEDVIVARIADYDLGYIYCSDCGRRYPARENDNYNRMYFAGCYCSDCWESKWKAIEAKETYD